MMDTLPEPQPLAPSSPPTPPKYTPLYIKNIPQSLIYDYICVPHLEEDRFKGKINYKRLKSVAKDLSRELHYVFKSIKEYQVYMIAENVEGKLSYQVELINIMKPARSTSPCLNTVALSYLYEEIYKICDTRSMDVAISILEDNYVATDIFHIKEWIAVCFDNIWSYVLKGFIASPGLNIPKKSINLIDIKEINDSIIRSLQLCTDGDLYD